MSEKEFLEILFDWFLKIVYSGLKNNNKVQTIIQGDLTLTFLLMLKILEN